MSGTLYHKKMALGEQITFNSRGLKRKFSGMVRGKHLDGLKRGKIRGFSPNSVRRLRELLFTRDIPGCELVGCTFTMPGEIGVDWCKFGDEFRAGVHRFKDWFDRHMPNSAMVYRVELQQRKAPHIHAIVYSQDNDQVRDIPKIWIRTWLFERVGRSWEPRRIQGRELSAQAEEDFIRHGVKVESVNREGMMRYLLDHTSKSKQAQLGWQGRQWGVFGSRNLQELPGVDLPAFSDERQEARFWRVIRRVNRYRVKAGCVFGSKLVGGRRTTGCIFCSPSVIRQALAFVGVNI